MVTIKELSTWDSRRIIRYLGLDRTQGRRLMDHIIKTTQPAPVSEMRKIFVQHILKDRSKVELLLMGVTYE